jgi:aminomethyltransferase
MMEKVRRGDTVVTSGGFGPTLGAPVAMGYVPTELSAEGARLFAEVRGKKLPTLCRQL